MPSGPSDNRKRVLVLGPVHQAGLDLLATRADVVVDLIDQAQPDIGEHLALADGIILRNRRFDRAVVALAPKLQIVARYGVGYDNVEVAALTERGVPLAVVGEANSPAVAEHALFLMLALAKAAPAHDQATRQNRWGFRETIAGIELGGRTILLIGFGRIGTRVAKLCQAFGMRVLVSDPYVRDARVTAAGCEPCADLARGLARADFVSIHAPLTTETRNLIGAAELKLMKPSAILINTARGGIVDETALADALESKRLAGAGIDVFATEPPTGANPLFGVDQAILSPHVAGISAESVARMSLRAAQNVLDAFDRRLDPAFVINHEVLTRAATGGNT